MHGNPHALSGTRAELNDGPASTEAALWLGLPGGREYFDPATLSVEDQARLAGRLGARRRADFEVSRALLALAGAGAGALSLSHSSEHAALLVAPEGCRTGVDLEIARPRDLLRLARFAFHEWEVAALAAASEDARTRLFYTLWTLKESFAKALGVELVEAIRQCVFWEEAGEWRGRVPGSEAWTAAVFQPRPRIFLAAVCIGELELRRVQHWEWPPKRRGDWPLIACASARDQGASL